MFKCLFEVLVLYLNISIFRHFMLPLNKILEAYTVLLTPLHLFNDLGNFADCMLRSHMFNMYLLFEEIHFEN